MLIVHEEQDTHSVLEALTQCFRDPHSSSVTPTTEYPLFEYEYSISLSQLFSLIIFGQKSNLWIHCFKRAVCKCTLHPKDGVDGW